MNSNKLHRACDKAKSKQQAVRRESLIQRHNLDA